jgi:hypothetical protein
MAQLASLVRWEVWLAMIGVMAIVAYQLLTGRINARGLLFDRKDGKFDPGRVQFLAITLFAALDYLFLFARAPTRLPALPPELLIVLGGSSLFYLGSKGALLSLLLRGAGRDDAGREIEG